MGNVQSNNNNCTSPLCKVFCFGSPPEIDDGEWFGTLPREKRRSTKKNHRGGGVKMLSVPEESRSVETNDDSIDIDTALLANSQNICELSLGDSDNSNLCERLGSLHESDGIDAPGNNSRGRKRFYKFLNTVTSKRRLPKVKLTFVNGQFVDMATDEGQYIAQQARDSSSTEVGSSRIVYGAVGGVESFVHSGHSGTIAPLPLATRSRSTGSKNSSPRQFLTKSLPSSPTLETGGTGKKKGRWSLSLRMKSDGSSESISSFETDLSISPNGKKAVTSMVELVGGHFLTASKHDRTIKMWKVVGGSGAPSTIEFVRNFVGHSTGVTCLAKVDAKGRFLSASKDRSVKVWDAFGLKFSDFCNDEDESNQKFLLATFENMDRRALSCIVMTQIGEYVRPTDQVDIAMIAAIGRKTVMEGSGSRIFSWRSKLDLMNVDDSMQFAITSIEFLGEKLFVTGSKSGNLRVWNTDGETGGTIDKEIISIMGAHNLTVTSIKKGANIQATSNDSSKMITFSSGSEDGKVLSFAIPIAESHRFACKPICFRAMNHSIIDRYLTVEPISVTCLSMIQDSYLVSGSSCGIIHILRNPAESEPMQQDSLILYRKKIEEEALTLNAIAQNALIELERCDHNRKMKAHKECFSGSDFVTYLLNKEHAASRYDALELGRVLASHFSLLKNVENKEKTLEDDKSLYRFSEEFELPKNRLSPK
ncbi:hypothetical protein ACHAXS_010158 [Conticribra weissflogii]